MTLNAPACSAEVLAEPLAAHSPHPWYAVRVKSQFEIATSRVLREKGYEQFVPRYRATRRWSDRPKEIEVPLFPGYVFCRFNAADPYRVLNSPGVVHIVSAGKKPLEVDDHEIAAIQAICRAGVAAEPWPFLQVGRRVVVERGPLRGAEGIIIEIKKGCRLVACLSLLQRGVATEIDRDCVRPVM